MKFPTDCLPVNRPSAVILPGAFFSLPGSDPNNVKRWIVSWRAAVSNEPLALAGDKDFAIDLIHALQKLIPEWVSETHLWPCVRGCPEAIYRRAAHTEYRMKEHKTEVWSYWANVLEEVGYDLPIWVQLREISERVKRRPEPVA